MEIDSGPFIGLVSIKNHSEDLITNGGNATFKAIPWLIKFAGNCMNDLRLPFRLMERDCWEV
ncbi:hypothetical protein QQP08_018262 [Theobroma cacao]|nr:hypothetical protein QQP08_018262 [Theobroma cacao]